MKLDFIVDENYIILHTLVRRKSFSSKKHKREVEALQNFVWQRAKRNCETLLSHWNRNPARIDELLQKKPQLHSLIELAKQHPQYEKILKQAQNYAGLCKRWWLQKYVKTERIMHELTGLEFKKNFKVYISHQSLRNGTNFGNGTIAWGHSEDWPNYTVVYLWHEILHAYFSSDTLNHALIEMLTDNELRVRLNGGSYPPFVGHAPHLKLKDKLMPFWEEYLQSEIKNIRNFQKRMARQPEVKREVQLAEQRIKQKGYNR